MGVQLQAEVALKGGFDGNRSWRPHLVPKCFFGVCRDPLLRELPPCGGLGGAPQLQREPLSSSWGFPPVRLPWRGDSSAPEGFLRARGRAAPCPLTHFEEGFELQRPDGRLLLQAPVGLGDALHLHLGALEELVGPVPVLDEAARDLQRQLPASTGAPR